MTEDRDAPPAPIANPHLLGQDACEAKLLQAYRAGRLPHGWLFYGRSGIGKATLAYRLARYLLAGGGPDLAMAEDHPVFRQTAFGAHPDLVVLEPKDTSKERGRAEIAIDPVRGAIDRLHRTAAASHSRVLVVDRADRLNNQAANAILKLLEEPRPGIYLILTAASPGLLPATLRSRVARLRLRAVAEAELVTFVERWTDCPPEMRAELAELAGGSPGAALRLAGAGAVERLRTIRTAMSASHGQTGEIVALADSLYDLCQIGIDVAGDVLTAVLRRAIHDAVGVATHPSSPDRGMVAAHPERLDRLWGLWDKLSVLDVEAERLSLDRRVILLDLAEGLLEKRRAA